MLKLHNICFSFENKQVLQDLSFSLSNGEILAVMGDSGCGKSTLLNLIAGLLKPKSGEIISNAKQISYVFQEPRLFPWLTVKENLSAVIRERENIDRRIFEALATVQMDDSASLYPDELSGGMKSRVSLARALAYGGDLFLLDEPFAALHEDLCATLAKDLREYYKKKGISAILVTHQRRDAELMADRILQL